MKKLFVLAATLVVFGCGDDVTVTGPDPLHEIFVTIGGASNFTALITSDGVPIREITVLGTYVIKGNTVCVTGQAFATGPTNFFIQVAGERVQTTVGGESITVCNQ